MRYQLGVEDIEYEHWIAWVFDLPGCYSSGRSHIEAVSNAAPAIEAYQHWLAMAGAGKEYEDPYLDPHVVEVIPSVEMSPGNIANAFFEDDRRPLHANDIEHAIWLLERTRRDLLAVVENISAKQRSKKIPGEKRETINGVLLHVGGSEHWYLDRLGLAFPKEELADVPMKRLEQVRAHLVSQLPGLAGNERIEWPDGEGWSARKLVRRALWHERDHTQHIKKLAAQL